MLMRSDGIEVRLLLHGLMAAHGARHPREALTARGTGSHVLLDRLHRLVPARLLEGATFANERLGESVGIVVLLQSGLAHLADLAVIERRLGIALDLELATFAHAIVRGATCGTLLTGGGVDLGDAGDDIFFRQQIGRDLFLAFLERPRARHIATGEGATNAAPTQNIQKVTAGDLVYTHKTAIRFSGSFGGPRGAQT